METLARNVVHFVRLLRGAGLGMSPAQSVDVIEALRWIDIERRDDVRATLAALLVHAPDEREIFDQAFALFWRDPDWEGKLRALLLPKVTSGAPPMGLTEPGVFAGICQFRGTPILSKVKSVKSAWLS